MLSVHPSKAQFVGQQVGQFGETVASGGRYREIINYGGVFNNVIANVDYATEVIAGTVIITVTMEASLDGSTWGTPAVGTSAFFPTLQYLRLTIDFQGSDNTSLIDFFALVVRLDVKREVDSGEVTALASDGTGTQVNFNKAFKDVDSLTVSPKSTVERVAIFDFVDAPNPTGFKVYLFDNVGVRVTGVVDWKARGIV